MCDMNRIILIDVDKLVDELEELSDSYVGSCSDFDIGVHNICRQQGVDAAIEVVRKQKSVDAVKHGERVYGGSSENLRVTCSECGYKINYFWNPWRDAKYCPNCGARIGGDKNEF